MARNIGVKGGKKWIKPNWRPYANGCFCTYISALEKQLAINKGVDNAEMRGTAMEVLSSHLNDDDRSSAPILKNTSHRDGSIYKRKSGLLKLYRLADWDETHIEPMMLSEPLDCKPDRERCCEHYESAMMQVFSLKLAKLPTNTDLVQLYGYIAVRDCLDSLLNYIVNRPRDDPIIARQGSVIEMTGPKRGISMISNVLFEFDMKIKKGEQEKDDLQLIDGAIDYSYLTIPPVPFTNRISGNCGAVDITLAHVYRAVEATVHVSILKLQSGFNLSLNSLVFIRGSPQRIQLFHGPIDEPCGLRRYVIAVEMDTWLHLKLKTGSTNGDLERCCKFKTNIHGHACRQIMLEHASISVKVTWSTVPV